MLEISPLSDSTILSIRHKLKVRVLFRGPPLKDVVISCIPRSKELAEDFDVEHEACKDDTCGAGLTLPEANCYLVVVRRKTLERRLRTIPQAPNMTRH